MTKRSLKFPCKIRCRVSDSCPSRRKRCKSRSPPVSITTTSWRWWISPVRYARRSTMALGSRTAASLNSVALKATKKSWWPSIIWLSVRVARPSMLGSTLNIWCVRCSAFSMYKRNQLPKSHKGTSVGLKMGASYLFLNLARLWTCWYPSDWPKNAVLKDLML